MHNSAFSSERSCLFWIRREICTDKVPFTSKNSSKQIFQWSLIWENNRAWTFSQEEALLWIIDSNFVQKQQFKVKTPLWWICFLQIYSFSLHKSLNSWIGVMCITCGLLQKLYQLFGLSFWWHLTAEDSLVSKSYNTKFLKISSDEETNWRRIHLSAFSFCFFCGWRIPLKYTNTVYLHH